MQQIKVTIIDPIGLHARPASALVQTANKFKSAVTISSAGKNANAKSIISIMALGVKVNASIEISAEGEDETAAIEAIKKQLTDSKIIA